MSQLLPCPACNRHVRQSESSCPFCSAPLSLADAPAAVLPRGRLGRAATFAFGATLVGATALVGCDDTDTPEGGGGTSSTAGTSSSAGTSSTAGTSSGGSGIGPVYGAPAGGVSNGGQSGGGASNGGTGNGGGVSSGGKSGAGGMSNGGTGGHNVGPVYGAPAGGSGGESAAPVYGAPPKQP